jgi:small-conductance mechanosensitive channel
MVDILEILTILNEFQIGENTALDYLQSISIFIFTYFLLYLLKRYILKALAKWVDRGNTLELSIIINSIKQFLNRTVLFIIGFYAAIRNLVIPKTIEFYINLVFIGIFAIFLMKFIFVLIDNTLNRKRKKATPEERRLVDTFRFIFRALFIIIIILWYLTSIGIDVTVLIGSLGIISLAIAFALQNTISDMFASLTIYFERPFGVGDFIRVGSDMGTVERIGIRSTSLRTINGNIMVIPNRELVNTRINNITSMVRRRIVITVGVAYATPTPLLRALPAKFQELIQSVPNATFDRAYLVNLGAYSKDFEIVFFVNTPVHVEFLKAQQEILYRILEMFEQEGVEIPFPTQIIVKEDSSPPSVVSDFSQ